MQRQVRGSGPRAGRHIQLARASLGASMTGPLMVCIPVHNHMYIYIHIMIYMHIQLEQAIYDWVAHCMFPCMPQTNPKF